MYGGREYKGTEVQRYKCLSPVFDTEIHVSRLWSQLRHITALREYWKGLDPWYPRESWHPYDPMLLSEGAFAAGMIFSYLKLVHIFSVNPHLGPLQISLGRMIIDILKFFFIYSLVLFAFGCGMNQLLWYYADLERVRCFHLPGGLPDYSNEDKACAIWRRFSKYVLQLLPSSQGQHP
ncbi:unnamed protein product [Timema podura]|uniref:Ion transport domain-containing protein n=1 Tax=Timema podura TaxID=61482 RepID=A0ABN7PET7_TIMPD|nr:unnamed protein product [Timema podura]